MLALIAHSCSLSAGQVGPVTPFFNDTSAPEHENAETLGRALFDGQSFEEWADLFSINTFSVFFTTVAFLGLLDAGSKDVRGWTSSVVNITSVSGILKLAQNHVCIFWLAMHAAHIPTQFAYNAAKAAASQLTKMVPDPMGVAVLC